MRINQQSPSQKKVDELYECISRRRGAAMYGGCPVDLTAAFVGLSLAESCGKCVPCRLGLDRVQKLLNKILAGEASAADLKTLETAAKAIYDSADCAIGFEAARLVLDGLAAFRDDYLSHIEKGVCTENFASVPCSAACPAHVDIPGYVALVNAGRYADAVRLIRKDNPFPGVCGLICEHPCERHCRRQIVDDSINIRALKRYAVEKAGDVPAPECLPDNGKKIAVIGGGPAGLTAAYFLRLKGFGVTVFEKRPTLGGMLRYGIPAYRLPDADLDRDINVILSTGVEVKLNTVVGKDVSFEELRKAYDSVYISIGAHGAGRLGCPGEDAEGVLSAVELLGNVADGKRPDFTGKRVVVVGGGNVAMDATRTSRRLGAASVTCVYRRRIADMTALPDEIEGAMAEECEVLPLMSPVSIQSENGKVTGIVLKPQIPGAIKGGRPAPVDSAEAETVLGCDIVVVAIGQVIDSKHFAENGVEVNRGRIGANGASEVKGMPGIFTGGDCLTGPATVIRAIDAGKVAAHNIEEYLGVHTDISCGVEIPAAPASARLNWGRVNVSERPAAVRKNDFDLMEKCITDEEAAQESSRCLRCDHFGCGAFRGGRVEKW